jgi:hypothetical protein
MILSKYRLLGYSLDLLSIESESILWNRFATFNVESIDLNSIRIIFKQIAQLPNVYRLDLSSQKRVDMPKHRLPLTFMPSNDGRIWLRLEISLICND